MNEFIEIHVCPRGEAMIIRKSAIESLRALPGGSCLITRNNGGDYIEVSDSYEYLMKKLIGEGEV